ncbi:hypothetical protein B0T17DRAFT_465992, partial [Bombardia bombarda]
KAAAQPAMMRIAIAGGGGFACILAQYLSQSVNSQHPEFVQLDCQVATVDYEDIEGLRYTLQGVDLLISTISGNEQLNLIDAARRARVRLFVPSEFEGDLSHRPTPEDPLNRDSPAALEFLERWSQSRSHPMRFTVFSCGIFMERFAPGGMQTLGIGGSSGVQSPYDYLVNIQTGEAEIVETNASGRPAHVALTSVYDVAAFIAAAVEMGPAHWPREFRMRGDYLSVSEVIMACEQIRGVPFNVTRHTYQSAEAMANDAQYNNNLISWSYYQRLLQTANGRYNVRQANLNDAVNQNEATRVRPVRFANWLATNWG